MSRLSWSGSLHCQNATKPGGHEIKGPFGLMPISAPGDEDQMGPAEGPPYRDEEEEKLQLLNPYRRSLCCICDKAFWEFSTLTYPSFEISCVIYTVHLSIFRNVSYWFCGGGSYDTASHISATSGTGCLYLYHVSPLASWKHSQAPKVDSLTLPSQRPSLPHWAVNLHIDTHKQGPPEAADWDGICRWKLLLPSLVSHCMLFCAFFPP